MNPIKQQKLDMELRQAVAEGNIPAIRRALAMGAHPGLLADNPFLAGDQRLPAFFWAAMSGNLSTVRLLLEMGFDPMELDEDGRNVLFHVPAGPQGQAVWDHLVEVGVDPAQPDHSGGVAWQTRPQQRQDTGSTRTWKPPRPTLGPTRLPSEEDE